MFGKSFEKGIFAQFTKFNMKVPENIERYARYFTDSGLFDKLGRFACKLGGRIVYCALVLYYALFSESVPSRDRKIILGALGYLILPIDLIPDFFPLFGFTDDVAALTFAVCRVIRNITPEVKAQARERTREFIGDFEDVDISFPEYDPEIDEQ